MMTHKTLFRASNFGIVLCQILFLSLFFLSSCTADDAIIKEPITKSRLSEAKLILKDSIVLNATAKQGIVNKTLLETGCPMKYYFQWMPNDTLRLQIKEFSVGNMPVKIWFTVNCKLMNLNSFEKKEYIEDGWVKFEGTRGNTLTEPIDKDYKITDTKGSGTAKGYLNLNTHEIEFSISFNVMNFSSNVYRQKIDPSRMGTFEKDFAQYEKDLAEYKKEHGIS